MDLDRNCKFCRSLCFHAFWVIHPSDSVVLVQKRSRSNMQN